MPSLPALKSFIKVSSSLSEGKAYFNSFITSRTFLISFGATCGRTLSESFSRFIFFVIKSIICWLLHSCVLTSASLINRLISPRLNKRATSQKISSSIKPYGAFIKRSFKVFIVVLIWRPVLSSIKPNISFNACALGSVSPLSANFWLLVPCMVLRKSLSSIGVSI